MEKNSLRDLSAESIRSNLLKGENREKGSRGQRNRCQPYRIRKFSLSKKRERKKTRLFKGSVLEGRRMARSRNRKIARQRSLPREKKVPGGKKDLLTAAWRKKVLGEKRLSILKGTGNFASKALKRKSIKRKEVNRKDKGEGLEGKLVGQEKSFVAERQGRANCSKRRAHMGGGNRKTFRGKRGKAWGLDAIARRERQFRLTNEDGPCRNKKRSRS